MSKTQVFCIAKNVTQAERAVEGLQAAGFPASEISVLLPDTEGKHDIAHVKATKAPEGATTGAARRIDRWQEDNEQQADQRDDDDQLAQREAADMLTETHGELPCLIIFHHGWTA